MKELQEILTQDSTNLQARRQLAALLLDNDYNEEALKQFLYLANIYPDNPDSYYNLGIAYEKTKNFKLAKSAYEQAIAKNPDDADYYYNLGMVCLETEDYDDAIENFSVVLASDENDSNTYFNLGVCFFNTENYTEALENFSKTVELNPQDYYAHFYLGNIFKEIGQLELAMQEFQAVVAIRPDYSWAYFNMASIYFDIQDYGSAIQNLILTIQHNPNDIKACELLVKLFVQYEQMDTCIAFLEGLIGQNEFNDDYYYLLAQVYKQMGDMEQYCANLNIMLENEDKITYSVKMIQRELKRYEQSGD